MAMAFSDIARPLAALLAASVLLSGCGSLQTASDNAAAVAPAKKQVMASGNDAPLPRQDYAGNGEKLPYAPQPNPYITGEGSVPAEAKSLFTAAGKRLKDGELKTAEKQFLALTEKYPALSGPWVQLGAISEKRDKPEQALERYRKAIAVNRNNVNAYIALGLLQRRQGKFADAQRAYLDALRLWKDFPEAHLNLAILYDLYVNKPEQAQKHYEAYHFLTGQKDENVHKWLVDIRRRTGIETSFVDNPPKKVAEAPAEKGEAVEATTVAAAEAKI